MFSSKNYTNDDDNFIPRNRERYIDDEKYFNDLPEYNDTQNKIKNKEKKMFLFENESNKKTMKVDEKNINKYMDHVFRRFCPCYLEEIAKFGEIVGVSEENGEQMYLVLKRDIKKKPFESNWNDSFYIVPRNEKYIRALPISIFYINPEIVKKTSFYTDDVESIGINIANKKYQLNENKNIPISKNIKQRKNVIFGDFDVYDMKVDKDEVLHIDTSSIGANPTKKLNHKIPQPIYEKNENGEVQFLNIGTENPFSSIEDHKYEKIGERFFMEQNDNGKKIYSLNGKSCDPKNGVYNKKNGENKNIFDSLDHIFFQDGRGEIYAMKIDDVVKEWKSDMGSNDIKQSINLLAKVDFNVFMNLFGYNHNVNGKIKIIKKIQE